MPENGRSDNWENWGKKCELGCGNCWGFWGLNPLLLSQDGKFLQKGHKKAIFGPKKQIRENHNIADTQKNDSF